LKNQYQIHLYNLVEVIPTEDFEARLQKVQVFDLLHEKSIVVVKRLLLTHKPPETTGTPEFKAEPKMKMRLPDMPLPVLNGDFNECIVSVKGFNGSLPRTIH
jgi:hypothetical protein